jgi:hypothetical protein
MRKALLAYLIYKETDVYQRITRAADWLITNQELKDTIIYQFTMLNMKIEDFKIVVLQSLIRKVRSAK